MTFPPSRRRFLKQASTLLAAASAGTFSRFARAAEAGEAVVETTSGKVRGAVAGRISIFKGVPYGASTGGVNRFMPPVKPTPWKGTRDALVYGATAPQSLGSVRPGSPEESEDCLVLNVFTPATNDRTKRPVMVWLHGGGFSTGSGSGPILDGTNLAQSGDVVVVTINHRLNVLGFTYLSEQGGADFALSGGLGMLDIVAALRWVRDNIAHFGGDPNLVTIFGQSGGGRKVATLMSMPTAQGLYHRAIVESGAVLRLTSPEDAIQYSQLLLTELGLKPGQVRDLQTVTREPVARGERGGVEESQAARARFHAQLADGGWQGAPHSSLGSGGTCDLRPNPSAHRLGTHRGDAL
jgi:para-nitrobenzyl esterase